MKKNKNIGYLGWSFQVKLVKQLIEDNNNLKDSLESFFHNTSKFSLGVCNCFC